MMIDVGRLLIILGFIIVALGIAILLAGHLPFIGHLPGDILNVLTLIFRR
jgi:Protein of unknown function (DUF2905)